MHDRKDRETYYHDRRRWVLEQPGSPENAKYAAYHKWYSKHKWYSMRTVFREKGPGQHLLDYGCGNGQLSVRLAKLGATVTGVDTSKVSIDLCKELAEREGVSDRTSFIVGNVEALDFPSDSFDVIWCSGILYLLDIEKAYREIARVLKPDGLAVAMEALGHNPFIELYRRRTPYVFSEDEHPLLRHEVNMADAFFGKVERRFFYLAALAGVPFRKMPGFGLLLTPLEVVDSVLLRLPWVKWQAWQVVMLLNQPKKGILN
ncbi:class I SAM-dependent methyltransferase [Chloroflexota bacterium]